MQQSYVGDGSQFYQYHLPVDLGPSGGGTSAQHAIVSFSQPYGMVICSKFSDTNSEGKDLYHWYFVFKGLEKGVDAQLICELGPLIPGSDGLGWHYEQRLQLGLFLEQRGSHSGKYLW